MAIHVRFLDFSDLLNFPSIIRNIITVEKASNRKGAILTVCSTTKASDALVNKSTKREIKVRKYTK